MISNFVNLKSLDVSPTSPDFLGFTDYALKASGMSAFGGEELRVSLVFLSLASILLNPTLGSTPIVERAVSAPNGTLSEGLSEYTFTADPNKTYGFRDVATAIKLASTDSKSGVYVSPRSDLTGASLLLKSGLTESASKSLLLPAAGLFASQSALQNLMVSVVQDALTKAVASGHLLATYTVTFKLGGLTSSLSVQDFIARYGVNELVGGVTGNVIDQTVEVTDGVVTSSTATVPWVSAVGISECSLSAVVSVAQSVSDPVLSNLSDSAFALIEPLCRSSFAGGNA